MLRLVRRGLVVICLALAWPAAAGAQAPTLTLKAPKATIVGHSIDFAGRISPAAANAQVRLVRGSKLVAYARSRRDGSFLIKVKVERPGPFRVVWMGASSNPVSVRIHPSLQVELDENRLSAVLRPAEAGTLRVLVLRNGKPTLDVRYRGVAHVKLAPTYGKVRIRVETIAREGYASRTKELQATLVPPTLSVGTTHPAVSELARRLAALHYAIPSTSATFSYDFVQSVYAFQKVTGLPRTGAVDATLWRRLEHAAIPTPRYRSPANHLEVDKGRQVLFVVRNGEVALVSPVSTAGIAGYYTPVGRFAIYRKVVGYDPSPLGVLLNPMYFYGGYAIHGNPSVPPYPASHGCIRVPNFVIYRLFGTEPYGETVYVY
jgi:L,D-transpeptidase-like protein/putative peptidoglycan binding protein